MFMLFNSLFLFLSFSLALGLDVSVFVCVFAYMLFRHKYTQDFLIASEINVQITS